MGKKYKKDILFLESVHPHPKGLLWHGLASGIMANKQPKSEYLKEENSFENSEVNDGKNYRTQKMTPLSSRPMERVLTHKPSEFSRATPDILLMPSPSLTFSA